MTFSDSCEIIRGARKTEVSDFFFFVAAPHTEDHCSKQQKMSLFGVLKINMPRFFMSTIRVGSRRSPRSGTLGPKSKFCRRSETVEVNGGLIRF